MHSNVSASVRVAGLAMDDGARAAELAYRPYKPLSGLL